jgi:hypothetical protein
VVGGVRSVPGRNEARRIGGIGDPPRRRFGFSPTVREGSRLVADAETLTTRAL